MAIGVAASLQAQEVSQDQDQLSETVIYGESSELPNEVTAFRTETPLLDVPQSITVISEEQIEKQGFTSLGEIVDYTPGLTNTQGEGHRDAIVFRGVRSTADFYVDGVRDDVQYYRALYNVEQVEVLRGPSALFFGRGGTGGVINRVMKKPVIGDDFNSYQVSVDTFGGTLAQFDYNQSLYREAESLSASGKDVVTVEDPFAAFRINAFYEYLNNHRDFFDGHRYGVNPTFAIDLGPDTRLDLSYEFNDHERFIDRGIPVGSDGRPVDALRGVVFGDEDLNQSNLESHAVSATLNHQFSDSWKSRVKMFYGDYDKRYQNFYASDYDELTDIVGIDGYVDTTRRSNLVFSGDLIGEFETFGIGNKLILGTEYIHTSSDQNRFNSFWDTTQDDVEFFDAADFRLQGGSGVNAAGVVANNSFNTDLADDTRVDIDTYSFYLQDEIALHRMLDLVLGARFDSFDIEVFNAVNGETRSRVDEAISPRLGLVFKPIERASIYGSYSETFLPRSGEQFANINGDNNALDPNTYSNLEGGIKFDLFPDLSLNLAIFEIEESSPQVSDADPSTLDVIDTQTTGFETQLRGNLTSRWDVSLGYSYLNGEQIDRGGPTGLRPRELPENTFSIWNGYQLTDRFGLGLGVVYQDDSFINNSNTATLPGYTRVDAALYYQLKDNLRLQVNFENLFDTVYYPSSHSTHQVTVGRPFNAAISISGSF